MFSALFIGTPATLTESHSQPGGLECQTGQAYLKSGPGRITVQKQTLRRAGEMGECTEIRISRPKNEKKHFLERGHCIFPRPIHNCEADTLSPYSTSIYSRRLQHLYSCSIVTRLGPVNLNPGYAPAYSKRRGEVKSLCFSGSGHMHIYTQFTAKLVSAGK